MWICAFCGEVLGTSFDSFRLDEEGDIVCANCTCPEFVPYVTGTRLEVCSVCGEEKIKGELHLECKGPKPEPELPIE